MWNRRNRVPRAGPGEGRVSTPSGLPARVQSVRLSLLASGPPERRRGQRRGHRNRTAWSREARFERCWGSLLGLGGRVVLVVLVGGQLRRRGAMPIDVNGLKRIAVHRVRHYTINTMRSIRTHATTRETESPAPGRARLAGSTAMGQPACGSCRNFLHEHERSTSV